MRIGRLIAVSILSVTALTAVLGTGVLVPQYRTYTGKTEAIRAVEAFSAVLAVGQQIAAHRAPYVVTVFKDDAATSAQLEAIAKITQLSDAAFEKARTSVAALSDGAAIVEGLNKAATKLADIRTAANRAVTVPMSARDPALVKGLLPSLAQTIAIVEPLLNRLENQVATADASLTALLNVARTAQDLRITAGGSRRHNLSSDQHPPSHNGGRVDPYRSRPGATRRGS